MKDIQKTEPTIKIPIQRVGIQNLKLPISVLEKNHYIQPTVADIDVYVDLDKNSKGIHMSRLIECAHISSYENYLSHQTIEKFSNDVITKSEAKQAELTFKFPYFIKKEAPVSKKNGYIHCNVEMCFINHLNKPNESFLTVEVFSTSLCPCSKEISEYGAHNQRSKITISGKHCGEKHFWIEDLVEIIEKNSSSEIYSILKRPDEKYVTEKAYENPKFVEDSSRDIYLEILNQNKFSWFQVEVINEESIHLHNAIAILSYGKK